MHHFVWNVHILLNLMHGILAEIYNNLNNNVTYIQISQLNHHTIVEPNSFFYTRHTATCYTHYISSSVSSSESRRSLLLCSVFWHCSGQASHLHSYVHFTLSSLHEQCLLQKLLMQPHLTSFMMVFGAGGSWDNHGIPSPVDSWNQQFMVELWI